METYLKENKLTRTELAKQLGVSKGYVSQILNGDYDHKLSKLMELSLAIGYKPRIVFEPIKSNKLETCDKIEKTISEVQESLRQIGYSAMCFKRENKYNSPSFNTEDVELMHKIIA